MDCIELLEKRLLEKIDERLNKINHERVNYCKVYNEYENGLQQEYEDLIYSKRLIKDIGFKKLSKVCDVISGKLTDMFIMEVNLDESYKKIDEILYKDLEPIKNKIREGLKLHAFHGSDLINLKGDVKEDTKRMFDYVMNTTDTYDKAYVMQSVVDRVLSIYFDELKKVNEDNVL